MNAQELIAKTKVRGKQEWEYWLALEKEIDAFFKGDHPDAQKQQLREHGYLEMVEKMCSGYRWLKEQGEPTE